MIWYDTEVSRSAEPFYPELTHATLVELVVNRVTQLIDLQHDVYIPQEHHYPNLVLVLADVVLSANRHYEEFVRPRVALLQELAVPDLATLIELIDTLGVDSFCLYWNYRHPQRVKILYDLAGRCLELLPHSEEGDEVERLRAWAHYSTTDDFSFFTGIPGFGFVSFQYLRILLGANTIKPDVHISNFIYQATGQRLSPPKLIDLLEAVATEMKVSASALDHAIWRYQSTK
jgi:hypothetical protein